MKEFDKALFNYNKGLSILEGLGIIKGTPVFLNNIGNIYEKQKNYKEATLYYNKSLKISEKLKYQDKIVASLNYLGIAYLAQNEFSKALKVATRSHTIAMELGYPDRIRISSRLLSKIAAKEKNWKKAYEMYKLSTEMQDSITNEKNQKAIIKSQFKYEYEKQAAIDSIQHLEAQKVKDAQIAEGEAKLKANRLQVYALSGGVVLLCIIGGISFFFYRNKQKSALTLAQKDTVIEKQRTIQQKLKALSAQMNPHFIFNSLNSIQYYITTNDLGNSELFLTNFAGLMRKTLDNSEHTFIYLNKEIETLKEYIELEKLRLKNQFKYTIHIGETIEIDLMRIPTLLIQPYVENAIWHGIASMKNGGKITVTIEEEDNRLKCVIDDNGVGRLKSKELKDKEHKSYAMSIAKTRLDLINTMEDDIVSINIIDKVNEDGNPTGTTVELYVPNDL